MKTVPMEPHSVVAFALDSRDPQSPAWNVHMQEDGSLFICATSRRTTRVLVESRSNSSVSLTLEKIVVAEDNFSVTIAHAKGSSRIRRLQDLSFAPHGVLEQYLIESNEGDCKVVNLEQLNQRKTQTDFDDLPPHERDDIIRKLERHKPRALPKNEKDSKRR